MLAWSPEGIRTIQMDLKQEGTGWVLAGLALLEEGRRGYEAELFGTIEFEDGALKKFDVVARGKAWGRQSGVAYAPVGKFDLVVAFRIAQPGESFRTLPVHNWRESYIQTEGLRVATLRRG